MQTSFEEIAAYLSASPLFGLLLTLLAYQAGMWLNRRFKGTPLLHPVLVSIILIVCTLKLADIDYRSYFSGAQFVHFLLGPVTVALAIPLYAQIRPLMRLAGPLLIALCAGCLVAIISALALAAAAGASPGTLLALAPKSATAPIAMGIAERLNGSPSLAMAFVQMTGIFGTIVAPLLYRLLRIGDDRVRGFALGVAAHGIGTARAFQYSETAGAFAALAIGLNGLLTALLVPPLLRWLLG
ncbi:MAG: LrgB family protein [Lautropia sp.]|nr:LrgB family protein [Lautropia sp.]